MWLTVWNVSHWKFFPTEESPLSFQSYFIPTAAWIEGFLVPKYLLYMSSLNYYFFFFPASALGAGDSLLLPFCFLCGEWAGKNQLIRKFYREINSANSWGMAFQYNAHFVCQQSTGWLHKWQLSQMLNMLWWDQNSIICYLFTKSCGALEE